MKAKNNKFVCRLNKKVKSASQFDTLITKEKDADGVVCERTIQDQKTIAQEVRKFYWKLYKKKDIRIKGKNQKGLWQYKEDYDT